jgi:5S rRNA maturation endonuclease (ribonuclease M5)
LEVTERCKRAKRLLEQLREGWIFVEGKKDKEALRKLGLEKVLTISGNLRISCRKLDKDVKVFVLTDLDRRGDQLARTARDELEGYSIIADLTVRKRLAHTLRIRYFEDTTKAYDELIEEGEKNG